ncbi:YfhO family protein [Myroides sp. DF42-4-2]|uniref:YfhO family protein n=1 Tax=unclassified Myroides TaxID=2642485 RepID=UPI002575DD0B|nr:YfhO family protein [Myroides sp. DF42-4-2]MDM1407612.1 YfhO family protein [Myroides sp. DF42-4-2]
MKKVYQYYPHILAFLGFILIALLYFSPVLQGKKLYQSDIVQYMGMAKAQTDFKAETGEELYWTDHAFLGMPTYQLGAHYPYNYIKKLDQAIRFLPRPADYLFLYFLSFYILLITLRIHPLKAFFGALAFGFSTYLIIIFGAGHNAKAHAIAYMPLVVAGVLLVFRKRYVIGALVTTLAVALEIQANHFQMTYYLLFLLAFFGVYYSIKAIRAKTYNHLFLSWGILLGSAIVALGVNATSLLATAEFSTFSIRHKSELTMQPDGSAKQTTSAMDYDYITEYSYGIAESLNLIFPRLFGGGMSENVGIDSPVYQYVINQGASTEEAQKFASNVPLYWGDQPIVEAPAYLGAIVFFLAVFCLFADRRKIKYVFLAGIVLTLLLSWGKNLTGLTSFFIHYIPLYDKFRAVSSIQVIVELCMPILAIMGLQTFFKLEANDQKKYLFQTGLLFFGMVGLLWLGKDAFSFTSYRDQFYAQTDQGRVFLSVLIKQRQEVYTADLLRSSLFVGLVIGALFLAHKKYVSTIMATVLVGGLMVADLVLIDKRYVNNDNFVAAYMMEVPFQKSPADEYILQDKSHYRVYHPQGRLQAKTNYFHKSVGGYSAVRPQKADEVFIYQVEPQLNTLIDHINQTAMTLEKSLPVLDMLNVKYLLLQTQDNQDIPLLNTSANGPAWFVESMQMVHSPNEEMKALASLQAKKEAIVNAVKFPELAAKSSFAVDAMATIVLENYQPNYLEYTTQNNQDGFAVFSEVFYNKGWNAYIDNQLVPHYEVNYLLRGLPIPPGKHRVEFKFEPQVIQIGSRITIASFVLLFLFLGGGFYWNKRKKQKKEAQEW